MLDTQNLNEFRSIIECGVTVVGGSQRTGFCRKIAVRVMAILKRQIQTGNTKI